MFGFYKTVSGLWFLMILVWWIIPDFTFDFDLFLGCLLFGFSCFGCFGFVIFIGCVGLLVLVLWDLGL